LFVGLFVCLFVVVGL